MEKKGIKYFRISCKTGEGINELIEDVVNSLIMKFGKIIDEVEIKGLNKLKKIEIILNIYYNY